ncbi:hypothetical protein EDD18DRAFT_1358656 [Armillaria luteobubalina]|uniref:Uncharacterized protein n=1 Tax=Armillaria luteobubalina TaxID=153913 RepID=A0AA39PWH7_9AGAR|nr:hypothetical protein EDD18DRAFT_1358656 [Armillaria luteobubalina]
MEKDPRYAAKALSGSRRLSFDWKQHIEIRRAAVQDWTSGRYHMNVEHAERSGSGSLAATTATEFIPQKQLGVITKISSDMPPTPLLTFSRAIKEFNDAQHAYRLGEEDGHFEASREMEQASYQQGYDAAIAKLTAAGNRLDGDGTVGRRARVDVGISASMQEDMEADDAFERGREAGYHDGLEEGQLEAGKGACELFFKGCSGERKDGAAKEKERWIVAGHVESGICRAGRKDLVDVATMVRTPSCSRHPYEMIYQRRIQTIDHDTLKYVSYRGTE